jgi:glycosyltransferase involved in cell wall biosynthesis
MWPAGSAEVVVSTYNTPRALDLALHALQQQTLQEFRICIADDGSGPDTATVMSRWQPQLGERLRHVWQSDHGFRKNRILNKAIASSRADYMIFLDGDCLPSPRFVERHLTLARPRRFCTGGVIRLSQAASDEVTAESVDSGAIFRQAWLEAHGALNTTSSRLKAGHYPHWLSVMADRFTTVGRTWNGGNSSTARINLIRVNGFDENFGYGAEDIELGYRLNNAGIRGRHLRYTATVLHLEHRRDYADQRLKEQNKAVALRALREGRTVTAQGIVELQPGQKKATFRWL